MGKINSISFADNEVLTFQPALHDMQSAVLCCAVLCCAVLCCAVLCFPVGVLLDCVQAHAMLRVSAVWTA